MHPSLSPKLKHEANDEFERCGVGSGGPRQTFSAAFKIRKA